MLCEWYLCTTWTINDIEHTFDPLPLLCPALPLPFPISEIFNTYVRTLKFGVNDNCIPLKPYEISNLDSSTLNVGLVALPPEFPKSSIIKIEVWNLLCSCIRKKNRLWCITTCGCGALPPAVVVMNKTNRDKNH